MSRLNERKRAYAHGTEEGPRAEDSRADHATKECTAQSMSIRALLFRCSPGEPLTSSLLFVVCAPLRCESIPRVD